MLGCSFLSISALPSPTKELHRKLSSDEIYLVDSGGQYWYVLHPAPTLARLCQLRQELAKGFPSWAWILHLRKERPGLNCLSSLSIFTRGNPCPVGNRQRPKMGLPTDATL